MNNDKNEPDIKNNDSVEDFKEYKSGKFYEQLYNDLPKEVVELLMETHPLMCKDEEEQATEDISKTKMSRRADAEAVRRARAELKISGDTPQHMKKTEEVSNIVPIEEHPEFEEEKDKILKITKAAREDIARKEKSVNNANANWNTIDDGDDLIQLVKLKGTHPKRQPRNINKSKDADISEGKTHKETFNTVKQDIDKEMLPEKIIGELEEITKEATLDKFFREDGMYEDDEKQFNIPEGKKIIIVCLVIGICLLGFLSFKTVSLTGKLAKANDNLIAFSTLKDEHSQLKLEKYAIEEELINLKTGSEPAANVLGPDGTKVVNKTSQSGTFDTYTVVEGDSYWDISARLYGNGAEYKKILEANDLKEDSLLSLGQKLKIPR